MTLRDDAVAAERVPRVTSVGGPRAGLVIRVGRELSEHRLAYLMLLPSVLAFLIFVAYPIVNTFLNAFSELDAIGRHVRFGTLENFVKLGQDQFILTVTKQTFIFAFGSVLATTVLALGLALVLNHAFPGRELAKTLVVLPWTTPIVVSGLTWRWIFHGQIGAFNYVLTGLHIVETPIAWLGDPMLAFGAIMFVEVWTSVPFMTIMFLAGLQAIPAHIYDAAKADGASPWREFRDMTIPQMRPVLGLVTLLSIIWAFRGFSVVWLMTRGQPLHRTDIAVTYLFQLAFTQNQWGPAFALSVSIFVLMLVFSVLYVRVFIARGRAQ